jgi:molybdate transport system ATP-binding protein
MKVTAIAGNNGSGKTQYIEQLRRRLASDKIRYIAFSDSYGPNVDGQYYLQLRWNQHDIDHETPTVGELLERAYQLAGEDTAERRQMQQHLYRLFHMDDFTDKYIITLSSGELRKFQLTKTLFANPRLLIMDNPFIGLDAETRDQLKQLLQELAEERDMQIMLVLSKTDDIPEYVTEVIELRNGEPLPPCTRAAYYEHQQPVPSHVLSEERREALLSLPYTDEGYDCQRVVDMREVSIRYDERTILNNVSWTVMNGERWALTGQNGSGKSTLLSLVCADNPQSYACDLRIFGRKRGTGESIWEIKRHIGYVSPEMHRAYLKDIPAIDIVASGLTDSVGLYTRPKPEQKEICLSWMNIFGIKELADRTFLKLSSGEQRLCLLARAFVKDPELLILDEPLHGLDLQHRALVKEIIDTFCSRKHKTMVMVTHYKEEFPQCITNSIYLNKK